MHRPESNVRLIPSPNSKAELARREGITRPRITQIMNLLRLAPDIQEVILGLPKGTGERVVTERKLHSNDTDLSRFPGLRRRNPIYRSS